MKGLCAAAVTALILYAVLLAFAPADLLLLADDDDVLTGPITRQQWEAHLQSHLQQARDYLNGIQTRDQAPATASSDSRIISTLTMDTGMLSGGVLLLAMLAISIADGLLRFAGARITHRDLDPLDLTPQHGVPRLPPIFLSLSNPF